MSMHHDLESTQCIEATARLNKFRQDYYHCLTNRADALFELTDALLCTQSKVTDLAHLSLEPEHHRGYGALYDAINHGHLDTEKFKSRITALPVPTFPRKEDGQQQIVLAVDVSNWLRPDANCTPERSFCHTYARNGQAEMIPGWPYSVIVALQPGASSWTLPLDIRRLVPGEDASAVTAAQIREVMAGLINSGQYRTNDPEVLVVMDAGYDVARLAWLVKDLPVILIARLRSNRVFYAPAGPRRGPSKGRAPRHGAKLALNDPATHQRPTHAAKHHLQRYGHVLVQAFERMHPKLDTRGGIADEYGKPEIIEGTIIGVQVEHLPGVPTPKPLWLWASKPVPEDVDAVDRWWSAYLRRFDLEHTFRFFKQNLGWVKPKLHDPQAADTWSWVVLTAYLLLRLIRPLIAGCRLPWQQIPVHLLALSPGRVQATYRRVCQQLVHPTNPPLASSAGPGRPKGTRNKRKRVVQPIGVAHQKVK